MEFTNVNRYVIEPVDFVTFIDLNRGVMWRDMGHRVRDIETQEVTPGLMLLDDAMELCLHMDKTEYPVN